VSQEYKERLLNPSLKLKIKCAENVREEGKERQENLGILDYQLV